MINLFQCTCVRANAKDSCVSLPFTRDTVAVVELSHKLKEGCEDFLYAMRVHYLKITTVLAMPMPYIYFSTPFYTSLMTLLTLVTFPRLTEKCVVWWPRGSFAFQSRAKRFGRAKRFWCTKRFAGAKRFDGVLSDSGVC